MGEHTNITTYSGGDFAPPGDHQKKLLQHIKLLPTTKQHTHAIKYLPRREITIVMNQQQILKIRTAIRMHLLQKD
jgi:hypothetical protein